MIIVIISFSKAVLHNLFVYYKSIIHVAISKCKAKESIHDTG